MLASDFTAGSPLRLGRWRFVASAGLLAGVVFLAVLVRSSPSAAYVEVHEDPAPGVSLVEIRRGFANAFLLFKRGDPSQAILIDAGFPDHAKALTVDVKRAGVEPGDLNAVILTHGHLDHAGGAHHFQKTFSIPIIAGAGDSDLIEAGLPDRLCKTSPIAHAVEAVARTELAWGIRPDRLITQPGALSEFVDLPGEIIPLAGHTEGSLIIVVGNAVFVGDLIRGRIIGSGPALHFFMCDLRDNARDIDFVGTLVPSSGRVFPGHFNSFSADSLSAFAVDQKK